MKERRAKRDGSTFKKGQFLIRQKIIDTVSRTSFGKLDGDGSASGNESPQDETETELQRQAVYTNAVHREICSTHTYRLTSFL